MEKNSIIKIALLGAESTGKTTLCEGLAKRFNTVFVPEYARLFLEKKKLSALHQEDLMQIAEGQLELEKKYLPHAHTFLFCDTALITIKIWSRLEFGSISTELENLSEASRFDFFLLTDNSVPWKKDELRQNKFPRELIMEMNRHEILLSKTPFAIVRGMDEKRLTEAADLVENQFPKSHARRQ